MNLPARHPLSWGQRLQQLDENHSIFKISLEVSDPDSLLLELIVCPVGEGRLLHLHPVVRVLLLAPWEKLTEPSLHFESPTGSGLPVRQERWSLQTEELNLALFFVSRSSSLSTNTLAYKMGRLHLVETRSTLRCSVHQNMVIKEQL